MNGIRDHDAVWVTPEDSEPAWFGPAKMPRPWKSETADEANFVGWIYACGAMRTPVRPITLCLT